MRALRTGSCFCLGVVLLLASACRTEVTGALPPAVGTEETLRGDGWLRGPAAGGAHSLELDANGIRIDGRYTLLRGGSVQYFRIPEPAWEDRLRRYRAAGFNVLDIYIPWNVVEPEEGRFDFESPPLRRFLELCQQYGIWVAVRPGPFITNEMDGGGLPAWLTRRAGKTSTERDGKANLRTADPDFMEPVQRYFRALGDVLAPYQATRGGPIVLYAVENEYTWFTRFFDYDKLFVQDGKPERPPFATLDIPPYMTGLRDMVRASGIEVPIVTCPGDARVSATGDVPGVIPFPNIYEWATPKQPEQAARDILLEMHDPAAHGGAYVNDPSGSLEVSRSPQEMRRLFMGGLDALFAFNVVGMVQEGRLNSMTLAARALDEPPHWGPPGQAQAPWLPTIFDAQSFDRVLTGFVAPQFGYFHNVLDYQGVLSPSGGQRKVYELFRRDNLFYQTVEPYLGRAGTPRRSGSFAGADAGVVVGQGELGVRESDRQRAHYWLDAGEGVAFLELVNQSGAPQRVEVGALQVGGRTLPRFAPMTIPVADEPNATYAWILPVGLPVSATTRLGYTTSELLTVRPFNEDRLLVLYGAPGSEGELRLEDASGPLTLEEGASPGLVTRERDATSLTLSYAHGANLFASVRAADGTRLRLVVTTPEIASRTWFVSSSGRDLVVAGPDYLESQDAATGRLRIEHDGTPRSGFVLSPEAPVLEGLAAAGPWAPSTQAMPITVAGSAPVRDWSLPLSSGRTRVDVEEASAAYDDAAWARWSGEPRTLEDLDVYRGHAWYRTELDLEKPLDGLNRGRLFIEHASDFVGIYVNGHYVTTVAPVGTEIDSHSINPRYSFEALKPYLRVGKNVLAFRTEIWGHGSFMFGRGKILATQAQLASVGYEGQKGLFGEATLGGIPLTSWSMRPGLTGELRGYAAPEHDDGAWGEEAIPLRLAKGDVRWLRTTFPTSALPDPATVHAPVVLEMKGARAKATVFLNGRLVGRWLSDNEWLGQGTWARPLRVMWSSADADHYPMLRELLRTDGRPNVLSIALEDASSSDAPAGELTSLRLRLNDERLDWNGRELQRGPVVREKREVVVRLGK